MPTPDTIFDALHSQLVAASGLSYVKKIFKGIRMNVMDDQRPCIMLEISSNGNITEFLANRITNVKMGVSVIAQIVCLDQDAQIVGNAAYKGILDIENDIRKAIDDDLHLSDNAILTEHGVAEYDVEFTASYPYRSVLIPVTILYRQTSNA